MEVEMKNILDQISEERAYQKEKWGTADEEKNTANDFVAYIGHYSTKWFPGGFAPYNRTVLENFRKNMLKTATIAVAAIEWVDKILENKITRPDVLRQD
jgi:penicillin V acylase-like amidase (Ntn superfamily)